MEEEGDFREPRGPLQRRRRPAAAAALGGVLEGPPPEKEGAGGLKRRGGPVAGGARKRRRRGGLGGGGGPEAEALSVARALSLSLCPREGSGARPGRKAGPPRAEKRHRLMLSGSPPRLLLQDPEKARRQTEERVARLLSEEDDFPHTPPLPPSRLTESELPGRTGWPVAVPRGPPSSWWERSSLVGPPPPGLLCLAGATLPARPDQRPMHSTALPSLGSDRPEATEMPLQERSGGGDLQGKSSGEERQGPEGRSQKEAGALQDLMELAGEGLTLTQWNLPAQQVEELGEEGWKDNAFSPQRERALPGQEQVPGHGLWSSPDESLEEELPVGSCSQPGLLSSLAAAFKGMVNNPHLSDVQFQVDSGELFYAHMFMLYARCPQLMEVVDQKGFWVAEEGETETRRVLLSDVSGEAAEVFLNYLYAAEHFVPRRVLPDVAALATRFGVPELAALCASHGRCGQPVVRASGLEEEKGRVETFEELLKSIWVGEEEEDQALLPEEADSENVVDEQELAEIYEFAATQREAEERCSRVAEEDGYVEEEEAVLGESLVQVPPRLQVWGARKEAVPGLPSESPQEAEEQRLLGAASKRCLDMLPPELGERKSLLAVPWGESLELFQQSGTGREPSDDAPGKDGATIKSPASLGHVPVSQNVYRGGCQALLGALASPKQRAGFSRDLSLTLFSPEPQEANGRLCQTQEREPLKLQRVASSETAAGCGADNLAPLPSSSSPVDLEEGPILVLDPEDDGDLGQGERVGYLSKEQEVFGARKCHLSVEVDIASCQGRGVPVQGTLPGSVADADGKRIPEPGPPLLSCRHPSGGKVAKLGLSSGPEAQQPGDAPDSCPSLTPSPQRQSLQGWLPLGSHHSPSRCSSTSLPRDGKSGGDVVVILDDSEEEAEAALWQSWGSSVLEADLPVLEDESGPLSHMASPEASVARKAGGCQRSNPPRNGTPPGERRRAGHKRLPRLGHAEEEGCSGDGSRDLRLDVWDKDDEMRILPLTQRAFAPGPLPKTPDLVCQEKEAPGRTPPTPMPSYSIMETPVLKKELSRFGVRTLPKKQMVLKLKEIFRYTHQRSDSRDEAASSQLDSYRGTQAALKRPTSAAAHSGFPKQRPCCRELPRGLLVGPRFGGPSGAGDQGQGHTAKRGRWPAGSSGRRKRAAEGPVGDGPALAASSKEGGLSEAAVLQSSSTEFETSMLMEEEEEEEGTPASQSTWREADTWVALRQYIHSRPALCRQILFYQPFELARLQSELKQNGIRIALGRLLDFLDAHCITFTTAEARREKQQQNGRQGGRKRRRC